MQQDLKLSVQPGNIIDECSRSNWETAVQLQARILNLAWDNVKCLIWAQFKVSVNHFTAAYRSVRDLKSGILHHIGTEEFSLCGISSNESISIL